MTNVTNSNSICFLKRLELEQERFATPAEAPGMARSLGRMICNNILKAFNCLVTILPEYLTRGF